MPYLNYDYLRGVLNSLMSVTTTRLVTFYKGGSHTVSELVSHLSEEGLIVNGRYRYVNFVRLLRSFGLFNSNLDGYDIIANLLNYVNSGEKRDFEELSSLLKGREFERLSTAR
jgi:hypothetical protein